MTEVTYQRARSPERKEQRRSAILAAARELALADAVRAVSLGDIARAVGQSKSSVLRYFESREDVFLALLLDEWQAWRAEAEERLAAAAATADGVAHSLVGPLAARPLLCDLLGEMSGVLEHNVSAGRVQAFKAASLDEVDALGAAVGRVLPALSAAAAREVVATTLVLTAGLWPIAHPAPHVTAMFEAAPALTRAHTSFAARLTSMVRTWTAGALTESRGG